MDAILGLDPDGPRTNIAEAIAGSALSPDMAQFCRVPIELSAALVALPSRQMGVRRGVSTGPVPGRLNLAPTAGRKRGHPGGYPARNVNLVPKPPAHNPRACCRMRALKAPARTCPVILEHAPSADRADPAQIVQLAQSRAGLCAQAGWLGADPEALLVVEFSGENPDALDLQASALAIDVMIAKSPGRSGAASGTCDEWGWIARTHGRDRPDHVAFIEDCAIPVERLGEFVRGVEEYFASNTTRGPSIMPMLRPAACISGPS